MLHGITTCGAAPGGPAPIPGAARAPHDGAALEAPSGRELGLPRWEQGWWHTSTPGGASSLNPSPGSASRSLWGLPVTPGPGRGHRRGCGGSVGTRARADPTQTTAGGSRWDPRRSLQPQPLSRFSLRQPPASALLHPQPPAAPAGSSPASASPREAPPWSRDPVNSHFGCSDVILH